MSARTSTLSVSVLALTVVLGHLTLFPKVADLDGFYHIGHAFAYAEGSVLDPALPWATQSIIGERGADLWWGFHVTLLPFTVVGDVQWAIRIAGFILTVALATSVLWILGRHGVAGSAWWAAFFLIAVPNVFFRHLMVRPHVLSLAGALALASLMARGKARHVFLVAVLITWLHLGLFWIAPAIAMGYAVVRLVEALLGSKPGPQSVPVGMAVSTAFLGTVVGWLLRPHAVAAGMLANVQIVELFLQKATDLPLPFAPELQPIPLMELARTSWLFLIAWLTALVGTFVYLRRTRLSHVPREERTLLLTALGVSAVFGLLAVGSARRAMEQWVAFGVLALPLFWCHVVHDHRKRVRYLAAVLLAAHVVWGGWRHALNVDLVAFEPDALESSARYMADRSEPGEVVFHARWDNFGPLFAFNRTNFYIGGMDPIFQLAHEPRFYWEYFYLSADVNVEWTCDAFPCASGLATDTHDVLRDHFGARWVLVEPSRNPRLALYLLNDGRYRLAHDADHAAVFEILDAPQAPAADTIGGAAPDSADAPPDTTGAAAATPPARAGG